LLSVAASILVLTANSRAEASCLPQGTVFAWSYPSNGDVAVPTNATFWAAASSPVRSLRAFLGKRELAVSNVTNGSAHRIQPGALSKNKKYVLVLEYEFNEREPGKPYRVELPFTTGSGTANSPPPSKVSARSRSDLVPPDGYTCKHIYQSQGCFGTIEEHPATMHTLDVAADDGQVAWLVKGQDSRALLLWPALCGAPTVIVPGGETGNCFSVVSIGRGGLAADPTLYCAPPLPSPVNAAYEMLREATEAAKGNTAKQSPTQVPVQSSCDARASSACESTSTVIPLLFGFLVLVWRRRSTAKVSAEA
jgi:hypothetical protein